MPDASRKRLSRTTFIYWMLLLYIMAALVWWFISLLHQNTTMMKFEVSSLQAKVDSISSPLLYKQELEKITREHKQNRSKYIGEGGIFLLLILVGAAFVYRSVRRQFRMQQQQQNFMMAVTHELKTPISVTRLNLETLQKYSLDPEKQKKLIRTTLDETSRLNFLTNNILISSQLDGGGYQTSKEDLDLSGLLTDCLNDFKNRFPDRIFKEQIEQDADVKGDSLLLQMMINNLLENAMKYSPKEGPVSALLKRYRSGIELQISDEGPGIPEEEKKKIFSKFYRIGNEATRKTQGTGLGLYLCQKIARDHNADISVTDNVPHGSIFTVIFKV
ncbi:MAG: two-component sensor histidine kinase [Chitinophagaceae bacterium]|nr:two-component sensor histidine kinase [Chitinophagaceae bacterium]